MPYSRRASIYEIEYIEDRDHGFVDTLLGDGGLRILEVPCGAGRLSSRLAKKASALTLVDIEPAMVAKAVMAATASNNSTRVRAEICDMRTLDLDATFELAIVPREALQLLAPEDGKRAICAIGKHVTSGGLLFVDLATFRGYRCPPADPDYFDPHRVDGAWREDWTRNLEDGSTLTRHSAQHLEAASICIDLEYQLNYPTGERDNWRSRMRLYRYERCWLQTALPDGMTLEAVYGNYDRSPFSNTSPRMLALYRGPTSVEGTRENVII